MTDPKTVLLIDDDESPRRVVEYNLREDGYRVVMAADGRSGQQRFQESSVDLVLTDVRMLEMDSVELLTHLKAMQPDLPVIVLTAHGTIDSAVEAMKVATFDYLTNPFSRDQLKASVRKALELGALASENRQLRQACGKNFAARHT